MDYFKLASDLTREHAQYVRDAKVTKVASEYMRHTDYRQQCIADVLECHDQADLSFLLDKILYGNESEVADAKREFKVMTENAASAYARSQQ
jgi:hypothetical protein